MTTGAGSRSALTMLRARRDEVLRLMRARKATNVRVFGSVAIGRDSARSDIDFLVSMAEDATLVDLIALEQDLEALLGAPVDVLTDDSLSSELAREIFATAVPL